MPDMAVIVPTRERPMNIVRLCNAWEATQSEAMLILGIDADDPSDYERIDMSPQKKGLVQTWRSERAGMNGTLNKIAVEIAPHYKYVGFMGDDHLPRTLKWDKHIARDLQRNVSLAYGNDLMQGVLLPTAVFMTSDVIQTLGYMAPPALTHLHLDTAWKEWGQRVGRLTYRSDVVIEHLHPQAGKTEWDEGYVRVNGGEMWDRDNAAWADYCEAELDQDVQKLRSVA